MLGNLANRKTTRSDSCSHCSGFRGPCSSDFTFLLVFISDGSVRQGEIDIDVERIKKDKLLVSPDEGTA